MSKRWYVLHARSGYEAKVKLAIEELVAREELQDKIGDILIPTEQVVEIKMAREKTLSVNFSLDT